MNIINKLVNIKLNPKMVIAISLIIVLISLYLFHILGFTAISYNIWSIIIISILIGLNSELKSITKSLLLIGGLVINDIGIKLYGGGDHDLNGYAWLYIMYFIEFILAYGLLIWGVFRKTDDTKEKKWIAVIIFPLIILLFISLSYPLGLGRSYSLG